MSTLGVDPTAGPVGLALGAGPAVGARLRALRRAGGFSLLELAEQVPCDKGHLSRVENGHRVPSTDLLRRVEEILGAPGKLVGPRHDDADRRRRRTADLLGRLHDGHVAAHSVDALRQTVDVMCRQHRRADPGVLWAEAERWLREAGRLLRAGLGLTAHHELLVAAGWVGLLVARLEADLGHLQAAEQTCAAARSLGASAGDARIVARSWETASWLALARGDPVAALAAAQAGRLASRPVGAGHDPGRAAFIALEVEARAHMSGTVAATPSSDGEDPLSAWRSARHLAPDPAGWPVHIPAQPSAPSSGAVDDDRAA